MIQPYLTWACFELSVIGGGGIRAPHYNFVVVAPMIMKFGTGIKLDVFIYKYCLLGIRSHDSTLFDMGLF